MTIKLKNKKVLVMGLGIHGGGIGVARYLIANGAKVKITDLKTKSELAPSLKKLQKLPIKYVLGKHRKKDFLETDIVVRNPAVPNNSPYLAIAKKAGVPIEMETSLFFRECPSKNIIGITGTKGKTTTTLLVEKILKAAGHNTVIGGNLCISILELLPKIKEKTYVVLELSSWQLEGLTICQKSPHIALITNIHPDHLNRYKSMNEYIKAKNLIFKYQKEKDYAILNKDNKLSQKLKSKIRSQLLFFTKNNLPPQIQKLIKIPGKHNLENTAAATRIGQLLDIPLSTIESAIRNFGGSAHRLEFVSKINKIKFYNDSAATNPIAAKAAINCFNQSLVWILGGADKNLDYQSLIKTASLKKNITAAILLKGTATAKIINTFKKNNVSFPVLGPFGSLKRAVKKAFIIAKPQGVVLLSPACASFGMFKNEFDRGERFKKIIANLVNEEKTL